MKARERISRIIKHEPVDRIGVYEHFWNDTRREWAREGHVGSDEELHYHFDLDLAQCSPFNVFVDLEWEPEILEETGETVVTKDANYAIMRRHKQHEATPEHIDFTVKEGKDWDRIKHLVKAEPRRIDFEAYRRARARAAAAGRFFVCAGAHVFEIMKNIAGHEHMLVGMVMEPDWVKDMVMTFSQLYVDLQDMLFDQEGEPDGIWYYEDMGFKQRPFMSPSMYDDIIKPGHSLSFQAAKSRNLPVIVHSCGFVEPLVPGLIEAGMDCLQVIEVKAGMDLLELYRAFGDEIAFMGGIDVRVLYTNDRSKIDAELEAKIPTVKGKNGYVLHSDHSIPNTVHYETYRYFIEKGLELGRYD